MATSKRTSSASPSSPRGRGLFSTSRKISITPSKSPTRLQEDEEEVYRSSPTKQMKQVRKSKSEKEKKRIYATAQDLGPRNTRWHISLPNIHDVREPLSKTQSKSPNQSPDSKSQLPPPPNNPPPVLHPNHGGRPKGRELVKSVSAGAINVINPSRGPRRIPPSPQGSPPVRQLTVYPEVNSHDDGEKLQRRAPPPKLPPPYSSKARAASLITTVVQEHAQSSTRSAPGELQKTPETIQNQTENETSLANVDLLTKTSTEDLHAGGKDTSKFQQPQNSTAPSTVSNDEESPLTLSVEGGVKSLARYFSARSKEGQKTSPTSSPKIARQNRGRQVLKTRLQKVNSIPETVDETVEVAHASKNHNLPPLHKESNEAVHKFKRLHDNGSIDSPGSPTHISIFSWYNTNSHSKSDTSNAEKGEHQNIKDQSFTQLDKVGAAKTRKESVTSPKSPSYKEYQNVLVETGTLVSDTSRVPSPKDGSQKKPMPLPRTQSRERGMGIPTDRERHLTTSDSEGALSTQNSLNQSSEYIDMIGRNQSDAESRLTSPDMVVFGAMDPEWIENHDEMIEREIEMAGGFSDSETELGESQGADKVREVPPFVTVKKVVKKTQSHNPNVPNIRRRNTPKEKRELRKGICSNSSQLDQDDYIPMQPPTQINTTPQPSQSSASKAPSELTASLSASLGVPQPHPSMDPRSSNYYLKILPSSMVKPPAETKSKALAPAKHYYIEIDIPDDVKDANLPQTEHESTSEESSPTKVSPVHSPSSAPVVEAKRKRKLKYPKISVGPGLSTAGNKSALDTKKTRKTPYSRLKLEGKAASGEEENFHAGATRQRSQGSIFAKEMMNYVHRPLPPTPAGSIYYKTINHPLSKVPAMRQVWHHEYIEIDENELNQKRKEGGATASKPAEGWINIHAAGGPVRVKETKQRSLTAVAPPVPQRPSCPYVEIDSEEMEEFAASLPAFNHSSVNSGPRAVKKLGPPPDIPGRPEETFRQRSFSSSGEYSYPSIPGLMFEWLHMKKTGDKGHFPTSPHKGGKKSVMETIKERGTATDSPPTVPPKTESLLREQMGLLAAATSKPTRKPSPYLVPVTSVKKDSASTNDHHTADDHHPPSPQQTQPLSPKEVISNLKRECLGDSSYRDEIVSEKTDKATLPPHLREKKRAMIPPSPPLPYQTSLEAKEKATVGSSPKVPKKKRQVSKNNSDSEKEQDFRGDQTATNPLDAGGEPTDATARLRKTRLQDRIDRNSLAMIIRNKSAISEKLEADHGSQKCSEKPTTYSLEKENVSVVKSLGDILLDVDSLLQQNMCTEEDLIAAIENQLRIKLVKKTPTSEQDKDSEDEAENNPMEESVQVTEQDVQEVVTFMNNSQTVQTTLGPESSEEKESIERSMVIKGTEDGVPNLTKHRSSTVIIVDDPVPISTESEDPVFDDSLDTPSHSQTLDEEEEAEMRDSRSSSVGLKPLRRVKARRKTNPASDMANLSVATNHFTQGSGVFTSKGGTLTNLTSEVEIEVPKGAVAQGKRQKLWFEVIQKISTPVEDNRALQELSQSDFSDSNSSVDEVGSFQSEKKRRVVQLSTMVLVGPSDAKFEQPIKIKMPHCLPYRNNSWHLHLHARASNCESDDWQELSNSSGLIIPQSQQRQRFFKDSTYQMHLHYAVVRTREMGCFKLCGSPMRNGSHSAKKMVASIFAKLNEGTTWSVLVVLSNAIHDQIQALDVTQRKAGYTSLEHSVPVLCFGEGKDMELSLCTETNSLPLATQVIPFGQFWRLDQVGQARATFTITMDQVEQSTSKTLTLKIQQAGSQLFHETNFVLAQ